MAAVSPAFIATTRRRSTPIETAAFVANRRVFFSFVKSAAMVRTSRRESFKLRRRINAHSRALDVHKLSVSAPSAMEDRGRTEFDASAHGCA